MRTLIFALAILLCLSTPCFAKVYLLVTTMNDIVSMSSEDDAVMQQGQYKVILNLDIRDIRLEYPVEYYQYVNKRFVLNVDKMTAEDGVRKGKKDRKDERELIYNRAMKDACVVLESEGVVFKKIKCSDF